MAIADYMKSHELASDRERSPPSRPAACPGAAAGQFWLPDTSTPEFAEQVAHDIAALAKANPEDDAMQEALERLAAEILAEWPADGLVRED